MERAHHAPAAVPVRPLTVGELLDSSVALLRLRARPLLALGAAAALVEQLVFWPLRYLTSGTPQEDVLGYLIGAFGLGSEILVITLLAAPAARAAHADMDGEPVSTRTLLAGPGTRWRATVVVAVVLAACGVLGAVLCYLPWVVVYGFAGLAVPALVVERTDPGSALARTLRLTSFRAWGVRVLGYLAWGMVRLAIGTAGGWALAQAGVGESSVLMALPWLVANAVAYPALACLDAALYLETRIRREGLDLTLALSRLRGSPAGSGGPLT